MNLKKLSLLVLTSIFCLTAAAQFKLSGKIINYSGNQKLQLNIPVISGFYKENSIEIPVAKDGTFTITVPIKMQKFSNLIYQRTFTSLLLTPKKNLSITINERDTAVKLISGTALPENNIMQQINLEQFPFFLSGTNEKRYDNLSIAELKEKVITPYYQQRDEKIKKVRASNLSANDKAVIAAEVKYITYNYLNDLPRTELSNKNIIDSFIVYVFDNSDKNPDVFPAGPQYYAFVDNYIRYLETKAFIKVKPDKLLTNELIPYYGITLDSAKKLVKNYGKPYWRWIGATKNLPARVVEQYTYQQLITLFGDKDLRQAEGLANAFMAKFPNSSYNSTIDKNRTALKQLLAQNELNAKIKIFDGYEKTSSIYDVINTLKGKVVYVDVWGTWCGPCKEELKYNPQLKTRFEGKDVAFVYLDMDEDDKDATWREYIKVNGLTGIHLRKTRETIAPFWKELCAITTDKTEYYPQYFIFDKEGKLVVSKAKRPSSSEALYQQIETYLK